MIYFAQLLTGSIKIGCSTDVDRRLGQLEQHYRQPVALLSTMEGDRDTEREIHERFAHLRFGTRRGSGRKPEQFRPGPDLMEYIGLPVLVSSNPETVEAISGQDRTGKAVRLDLDSNLHAELRIKAAKLGKPMAVVVRDLVIKFLADRRKKGGK